jgi:2-polyprenyl-6-methoxyphenol hydroxylase-like FAD-dependent oxidoreductase
MRKGPDYDAVIVGAGPAGAALALGLCNRGWAVALLDARPAAERTVGECLHGVAQGALRELGLWDAFRRQGHRSGYLVRSVWDSEKVHEKASLRHRYGPDWHLDRARFDEWLITSARQAGAVLLRPARIGQLERTKARQWRLTAAVAGGEERVLRSRYLVDATGRSAWLSRKLGAARTTVDPLVGIARWFHKPADEPVMLIETAEEGWWYSAPAPRNELVMVWMTDAKGKHAQAARDQVWEKCLAWAPLTRDRAAGARARGRALVRVAGPSITDWNPRDPWLPIGDAAAAFDPVSGDGLCFALRSALEAAWVLEEAARGDPGVLEAYREGTHRVFARHLEARGHLYQSQRRWPGSRFWGCQARTRGGSVHAPM